MEKEKSIKPSVIYVFEPIEGKGKFRIWKNQHYMEIEDEKELNFLIAELQKIKGKTK